MEKRGLTTKKHGLDDTAAHRGAPPTCGRGLLGHGERCSLEGSAGGRGKCSGARDEGGEEDSNEGLHGDGFLDLFWGVCVLRISSIVSTRRTLHVGEVETSRAATHLRSFDRQFNTPY